MSKTSVAQPAVTPDPEIPSATQNAEARLERIGVLFRRIKAEFAALHHDLSAVPQISRPLAERIYDEHVGSTLGFLQAFNPIVVLLRAQECWPADDDDRLTEEVPVDDDELSARLIELAKQEKEDDFRWLARSQGVPEESLDALWQGTCQRLRRQLAGLEEGGRP